MFFFLLLLAAIHAQEYDEVIFKERWLVKEPNLLGNLSTLISPNCYNDTITWLNSMVLFSKDMRTCLQNNGTNCTSDVQKRIMMNFYGVKQLDSFGRIPSGLLEVKTVAYGDLQECQEVSKHFYYHTQYCFLHSTITRNDICSPDAKALLKSAVCMPKSCSNQDILTIFNEKSKLIHSPLTHCSVTCKRDHGITDTFTWIFLGIMCIIVGLCLVASTFDFILESFYQTKSKDVKNPLKQALLSFSIYTNGSTVWNTSPPREGHLKCLDCIRFLSMVWVASGHVLNFTIAGDQLVPFLSWPKAILADTLMNAFFSVDTFFVISGLLVSYMFFKAVAKSPKMVKNPLTWVLFYVHRYLRLTPPYMLFICFFIVVAPLMTGVLMTEWDMNSTVEPCRKHWWKNLVYINNFDVDDPCYDISWYLACDMQMFVVAPVFLIAFVISQWLGLAAVFLACIGSSIATIVITIHYQLPATPAIPKKISDFNKMLYNPPWIRCPPYLIGMVAGYYLAKFGNKRLKIHRILPLVGWMLSTAMALAIIYGPHDYLDLKTSWSYGVSGFYNAASRIGWALFIVWVIGANHYGYGGPIASLMEHPIWQPFGRLSYTAYLCHFFLIYYLWNLQDRPLHFTGVWSQFIQATLPVVVMAYTFAFFWSCLCEIPFLKLEKMLFDAILPKRNMEKRVTPESQNRWSD